MRAILISLSLLLFFSCQSVLAERFRLGPVYTGQPGELSVVVELPPGVAPAPSDLRLLFNNGQAVPANDFKTFKQAGRGLTIVVSVDTSKSMRGPAFKETKKALLEFLAKIRPDKDYIAIVPFGVSSGSDIVESDVSNDRTYLSEVIRTLRATGNYTKLYQALYQSLDRLDKLDPNIFPKRRRVLVISDGKDEGSHEGQESVVALSRSIGIPIDAIGRGELPTQYLESLRGLARLTDGHFVLARPNLSSLNDAFEQIYEYLMGPRTRVYYFRYETDSAAKTAPNAVIEMRPTDRPPVRLEIPGAIPLPAALDVPPPPIPYLRLLILITAALLILGLIEFLRRKNRINREQLVREGTDKGGEFPRPIAIEPSESSRGGHTEVGGYSPEEQTQGGAEFPAPRPGQPAAKLIGIDGLTQGREFCVEKELFRIGANSENDLVIADDDYVSGNHAQLRYDDGRLFLSDQQSRNGTFLNGEPLGDSPAGLARGDLIQIGNSTLKVVETPIDTDAVDQEQPPVR